MGHWLNGRVNLWVQGKAARTANPAARQTMNDWLPIQSAPKDGTLIILGWMDSVDVGSSLGGDFSPDQNDHGSWFLTQPTHWQPMPDPPKENLP